MLKKELSIFTFNDLLHHFPFRHIDKSKILKVGELNASIEYAQVQGTLVTHEIIGERNKKRLVAYLKDSSGILELTWFKGISWVEKTLKSGENYLAFGRCSFFMGKPQIVHPELEVLTNSNSASRHLLEPVYSTTEKLKTKALGARQIAKIVEALLVIISEKDLPEILPDKVLQNAELLGRFKAYNTIHFPDSLEDYSNALRRLKFEEFFLTQLRLAIVKSQRHRVSRGIVFQKVGDLFNTFFKDHLPFELTGAQKRVMKEIRADTASGHQMNRLLQGDVGSGKTIVALLTMLLAIDNGFQCCLMAPTEILAQQHFTSISRLLRELPLNISLLTGSTKVSDRKIILSSLEEGNMNIVVGTHALIEEVVKFKNLGLAIVDEQHRFGVAQRAMLWNKASVSPHVLVMTATPIPRTLAMTAYGDLDYSVINELPPGRQPITTVHRYDTNRSKVLEFVRSEIEAGRQAYIIFPLIEESSKLDFENLMQGYEIVKEFFPEPKYQISMVHGRQNSELKQINMQRFVKGETQIMVSTTVIEVGVDVPNASVMVIESAEKFGLSQLHQLRGRVGRGSEKSYCVLMTSDKIGNEARERIKIMTSTNDGFLISEKDLELRGPGEIEGTRQSGALNFKLADIINDKNLLDLAKAIAEEIIHTDPELKSPANSKLNDYLKSWGNKSPWSKIS